MQNLRARNKALSHPITPPIGPAALHCTLAAPANNTTIQPGVGEALGVPRPPRPSPPSRGCDTSRKFRHHLPFDLEPTQSFQRPPSPAPATKSNRRPISTPAPLSISDVSVSLSLLPLLLLLFPLLLLLLLLKVCALDLLNLFPFICKPSKGGRSREKWETKGKW